MSEPDFSVLIAWNGPEDKPFYRALLVSASQAALIDRKPFWGYAIISAAELQQLIDVLIAHGRAPTAGPYTGAGSEYYVEIQIGREVTHYSLGFDRETLQILMQMADALAAHQQPLQDIVTRIKPAVEQRHR